MMKKYYIQLKNNSHSLIDIIQKHLKISMEQAFKTIIQGSVWNSQRNKRLKDKDQLIKNDLIFVNYPEFPIIEYFLEEKGIKYEDNDFIIVYKEAGLNTCPTPLSDIDCLAYGVQKYYDKKKIKYEVSTINRLDKPTKGLLFYAKNKKTEILLHEMFKNRQIKKLYIALTPIFDLKKHEYLIKDNLEWKGKSQEAVTFIKFIKEKNGLFYFAVYPLTGRTHQIRKHFQKYLTPIIGDALYGKYSRDDEMELICYKYIFKHPLINAKIEAEFLPEKYICG